VTELSERPQPQTHARRSVALSPRAAGGNSHELRPGAAGIAGGEGPVLDPRKSSACWSASVSELSLNGRICKGAGNKFLATECVDSAPSLLLQKSKGNGVAGGQATACGPWCPSTGSHRGPRAVGTCPPRPSGCGVRDAGRGPGPAVPTACEGPAAPGSARGERGVSGSGTRKGLIAETPGRAGAEGARPRGPLGAAASLRRPQPGGGALGPAVHARPDPRPPPPSSRALGALGGLGGRGSAGPLPNPAACPGSEEPGADRRQEGPEDRGARTGARRPHTTPLPQPALTQVRGKRPVRMRAGDPRLGCASCARVGAGVEGERRAAR
jgi:hypothetical protein